MKQLGAWTRRHWSLIFQILLLGATVLALALGDTLPVAQRQWLVALVLSIMIWHWLSVVEAQEFAKGLRAHPAVAAVSLGVLIPPWFLLVQIHPAYYLLLPGLAGQAFITLPARWAVVMTLLLALLTLWSLAA